MPTKQELIKKIGLKIPLLITSEREKIIKAHEKELEAIIKKNLVVKIYDMVRYSGESYFLAEVKLIDDPDADRILEHINLDDLKKTTLYEIYKTIKPL